MPKLVKLGGGSKRAIPVPVSIVDSGADIAHRDEAHDRKMAEYRAEDDARTLGHAHEIMGDHERRRGVRRHLGKKLRTMGGLHRALSGKR